MGNEIDKALRAIAQREIDLSKTRKLSASSSEEPIEFPKMGPYGINGTHSTIFVASPDTAANFVRYLRSQKVKAIYTGKLGSSYHIGWDSPKYIDVNAWKAAGFKTS